MTLDVEFIKQILTKLQEADAITVYNNDLLNKLDINSNDEQAESKFIKHILDLRDLGAIDSNNIDMGYSQTSQGHWINHGAFYRLTIRGHQLLEIMNNDNWWTRVKADCKEITVEALKQATAIVLTKLVSC